MRFWIFILLIWTNIANAQDQHIDQGFKLFLKSSGQYALFSVELEPGAKFYWRHPGELGLATKFNFNKSENLESAKVFWPVPELYQANNVTSYVYQGKTNFVIQPIAKKVNNEVLLSLNFNFTICKETCENHEINLKTTIPVTNETEQTEEIIQALTKTPNNNASENFRVTGVTEEVIVDQHWLNIKINGTFELINPRIFLDLSEYVHFDPAKFELSRELDGQLIRIPVNLLDNKQVINKIYFNLIADNGHAIEYESYNQEQTDHTFIWIILYAFFGGVILNIMPCVLPILALKTLQIVKLSGQANNIIRKSLLAQAMGIIISFIAVALITYGLQQAGRQVGLGLQFQQSSYLVTMVIILSLIAINLVENITFNIKIPDFIVKFFPAERRDLWGFFLSGILATMLAIPCTAPFITIAVGFALTANFFKMLVVFIVMGTGMAMPYLALALFPQIGRLFPKPGEWMIKFKKILGIVIFTTSIWLMYVISTQLGNKAGITLFLLIILIKFTLTEKQLFTNQLKLFIIIILMSLCYFVPDHLYEEKHQEELLIEDVWREYKPGQITALIDNGHVVLLDVTASWCATCNMNKVTTMDNNMVMALMKKRGIIGMRADISAGTSSQVSTLMKMHRHYGIPLNIIYSKKFPQGIVLPTFLTPNLLITEIKKAS